MNRFAIFFFTSVNIFLVVNAVLGNTTNVKSHIVGGYAIAIAAVPWQASMRVNGNHTCGASIISPDWMLTAAQCAISHPVSVISFKIGSADRLVGGIVMYTSLKVLHPFYNAISKDYDVAVYKLTISITYSSLGGPIRNIQLPNATQSVNVGTSCLVSGWGITKAGATTLPVRLQAVSVPIVSETTCQSSYGTLSITPRMVCAGYTLGGRDTCEDDIGGPMVATLSGIKRQVGIISWSSCGVARKYGVYTFVPSVRAWIKTITGV